MDDDELWERYEALRTAYEQLKSEYAQSVLYNKAISIDLMHTRSELAELRLFRRELKKFMKRNKQVIFQTKLDIKHPSLKAMVEWYKNLLKEAAMRDDEFPK